MPPESAPPGDEFPRQHGIRPDDSDPGEKVGGFVHEGEHECVFVEEQEPSGRLILPPCLVCDLSALDALEQLRGVR